MDKKKLIIGWFSFTCCEDSSIVFTELLNDHFFEWKELVEFRHVKILKTNNVLKDLDVAFVEGAISSEEQAEELRNIRANSKKLVAIGACAVTSRPSGNRNDFPEDVLAKYKDVFETFKYSDKVLALDKVVEVNDAINGCPMNTQIFLTKLDQYLVEFGIK
jgi:sulfhydrogenase subunit delta